MRFRRPHKGPEERVGLVGSGLELRVELDPHEPGMVGQLHHLHQPPVRGKSCQAEPFRRQHLPVGVVELIAVAVPFGDGIGAIGGVAGASVSGQTAGVGAQTHGTAQIGFFGALFKLAAAVLPAAGHEGMFQVHSPWQTEDSPQIAGETLEVQVEEAGRMTIRYFIAGKGQVEALGAEEIVIRHKVGGVWMETVRYDRKTDELWTEGTMEYGGEISYQGRPGERYQVEVLFFAENEAGYDSRRQTWEVTAE